MAIQICEKKETWKSLTISLNKAEFLQSWEWGEFQAATGNQPLRLVVDKTPVQGFVHCLPFGFSFVYFPRIPTLTHEQIKELKVFLKKQKHIFARIEPAEQEIKGVKVSCRQPQTTLILNIEQDKEALLTQMHAKTRYNIRLAAKKGVLITREKNSDIFSSLNKETSERDGFKSHEDEYYTQMLESPLTEQLIAWYEEEPIATILCIEYKDTVVYLHGASANEKRNVMAPYLLQWTAIEYAKQKQARYYDFWGVAPQENGSSGVKSEFNGFSWGVNHPWTGVTRFKVGFGGDIKTYPGAVEWPLRPFLYRCLLFVKKIINKRNR